MTRLSNALALVLLCLAAPIGCTHQESSIGIPDAIIIPRQPGVTEQIQEVDDEVFAKALQEAENCRHKLELESALSIVNDVLESGPPPGWYGRFSLLRSELRRETVQRTVLDAFIQISKSRFEMGEVIEGELVLQNISGKKVIIPSTRRTTVNGRKKTAEARSIFHTTVAFTEYSPFDLVVRNSQDKMIIIDKDIALAPGAVFSLPLSIDSTDLDPAAATYRTYAIAGTLHPSAIQVGDDSFTGALPIRGAVAHVFPRNYKHLAAHPLKKLKEAVSRSANQHMPVATALLAPSQTNEACEFLFTELNRVGCDEDLRRTIITCLRIITGARLGGQRSEWNAWRRAQKTRESQ